MMANLDKKMLNGFSREVKSYLPFIKESIENFQVEPAHHDILKDALRYLHTIKGASALMGLVSLSQVTAYIEDLLESMVAGQICIDIQRHKWLEYTIDQIDPYLDYLLDSQEENEEIIKKIEKGFYELGLKGRNFKISNDEALTGTSSEENEFNNITYLIVKDEKNENKDKHLDDIKKTNVEANNIIVKEDTLENGPYTENFYIDKIIESSKRENENTIYNLYRSNIIKKGEISSQKENSHEKFLVPFTAPNVRLIPENCEERQAKVTDNSIDLTSNPEKKYSEEERNKFYLTKNIEDVCDIGKYQENIFSEDLNISQDNSNKSQGSDLNNLKVEIETPGFHSIQNREVDNVSNVNTTESLDSWNVLTDESTKASEVLESIISDIDEDVRRLYQTEDYKIRDSTVGKFADHSERYLLFKIGKSHYASSVHNILEICQIPSITPLPNTPDWLKGLINLRGEILSVIDLSNFFDIDTLTKHEDRRLLIVRTEDGRIFTSLIVDQVSGFVRVDTVYDVNTTVRFHDKIAPYLNGIFEFEGLIFASLDLEGFLKSSEVCQFQ